MKFKIIIFNLICFFIIFEISARIVIRSERLMDSLFNNTTNMWLTSWQNKPKKTSDLYSTRYEYDKKLGWDLKGSLNAFYDNDSALFVTNSDGIRSEKGYSYIPNDSIIRIALIGDSYTEGAEVANNNTWSYFLQEKLGTKFEVLNFGVRGDGHNQCLIKIKLLNTSLM